ncbi:DUF1173 family protein [Streptomyces rhizosphaericus]|uniref:DUF1173 family protein n=1 Tax=Streptomyces rhizosphaericus TaxID=114699 RepID=UPI00142D794C|nr:DUF1173 family protein [Streptomyces rhizosphaericus]
MCDEPGDQRVKIANRVISLRAVRRNPTHYADQFSTARSEGDRCAYCLCTTPNPRLVIRARAGRFHLAGWPAEGNQHAPHCDFYKLEGELSGKSLNNAEAILESDSGTSIRLATPLVIKTAEGSLPRPEHLQSQDTSETRRAVGLLGLLHYLWEQAQLNCWYRRSYKRTWHVCHARLRNLLDDCTVNGRPIAAALYLVPPYRPQTAQSHQAELNIFLERLGDHQGRKFRGLFLGEIRDIRETPYGHRIDLRHMRNPFFAKAGQLNRWTRSYGLAFSAAVKSDRARRIALLAVEKKPSGTLAVMDGAFMLTNTNYIPADSSYELLMADALAKAGRRMIKPLRYDHHEEVFPDFVLTDTTPPTFVEVYGVKGRLGYELRKLAKQQHYRSTGQPVIEWDVDKDMPLLTLPRSSAQASH